MGGKKGIMSDLSRFKKELSKRIAVQKMILFGSYARGDYKKESDVDLIIVSSDFRKTRFVKRSLGFYKFWPLNLPVDYICYSPEEFEKQKKRVSIVSMALKEGVEIA
jgi:predicted nucleotidyltransferase